MNNASKKFLACRNLGLPLFKGGRPPVNIAWVPAEEVEKLLSTSLPVFSKKNEDGLYLTWSRKQIEEAEVLGFVLGPYQIPEMPKEEDTAAISPVGESDIAQGAEDAKKLSEAVKESGNIHLLPQSRGGIILEDGSIHRPTEE